MFLHEITVLEIDLARERRRIVELSDSKQDREGELPI